VITSVRRCMTSAASRPTRRARRFRSPRRIPSCAPCAPWMSITSLPSSRGCTSFPRCSSSCAQHLPAGRWTGSAWNTSGPSAASASRTTSASPRTATRTSPVRPSNAPRRSDRRPRDEERRVSRRFSLRGHPKGRTVPPRIPKSGNGRSLSRRREFMRTGDACLRITFSFLPFRQVHVFPGGGCMSFTELFQSFIDRARSAALVLAGSAPLALAGCGGGDDDKDEGGSGGNGDAVNMVGTWTVTETITDTCGGGSYTETFTFTITEESAGLVLEDEMEDTVVLQV